MSLRGHCDRLDRVKCVIHEAKKTHCGRTLDAFEWAFVCPEHASASVEEDKYAVPCSLCIRAVQRGRLKNESGDRRADIAVSHNDTVQVERAVGVHLDPVVPLLPLKGTKPRPRESLRPVRRLRVPA
jgi:hypothetical protein